MGWPARHSRSPKLHGYWIKRYGIDGDYRVAEIPPEEFPAFLKSLAQNGYVGGNVTMPHKDVAFALSEPDARAARSAPPLRCGSTTASCAHQHRTWRASSARSTPTPRAGTA
jgi:hypothetical protein